MLILKKNGTLFLAFILLIFINSCLRKEIKLSNRSFYYKGKLKISIKNNREKQNFKLIVRMNNNSGRIIVLNPLNIAVFKIIVKNKNALILNFKKKVFWKGNFSKMVIKLFNLDLSYADFFNLIVNRKQLNVKNYDIKINAGFISIVDKKFNYLIRIKIIKLFKNYSTLVLNVNLKDYKSVDFEEIFVR